MSTRENQVNNTQINKDKLSEKQNNTTEYHINLIFCDNAKIIHVGGVKTPS